MSGLQTVLDRFVQAFYALRDNRLRTMLSILGIAIGIASVMAVGTVSKGGNYMVNSELETFGLKSVWVYRNYQDKDPHRRLREGTGINLQDYLALTQCCSAVNLLGPTVYLHKRRIVQTSNHYSNAEIQGVGVAAFVLNNDTMLKGRFFRAKEISGQRAVAVLGPTAAKDLFGARNPVGKEFRLGLHKISSCFMLWASGQ